MKPFVHTFFLALILTIGINPTVLLSQDNLSNWYVQEVFLLADLNQDKYLSEIEILALRENFAYYQNPENFDLADKNKDNYLDYQEFRYRFGQALVHRQEIDGKELKILSENYPYFENAAYKYLKRHPELTEKLMNNLLWTREHPDLMKQIISDRSWLSKEPSITESLSSNLIWLTENPNLARKFYQIKKGNAISDIWRSWGITHSNFMEDHKAEAGVQIDFPFWPTETPPETELLAEAPSPGAQQKWVDSLLMKNESLQLSIAKVQAELNRRDSVAEALFANQESVVPPEARGSLKAENEALRTRVRKMLIEKRLALIEENKLLATTITQKKQIAFLAKKQELSEEDGNLTISEGTTSLEEELARYEAELASRDERIDDLNNAIAEANQANMDLMKAKARAERLADDLQSDNTRIEQEKEALINTLASNEAEASFLKKEQELQNKINSLEQRNADLLSMQQTLTEEKEDMESSIARVITSKQEENAEITAIEEQYKQQILALDIELEKMLAMQENAQADSKQKQTEIASELQRSQDLAVSLESKVLRLEKEKQLLEKNLAIVTSENAKANEDAWTQERNALSEALAQSKSDIEKLKEDQENSSQNFEAEIHALAKEKEELSNTLAKNNQQIVGLLAEQELMSKELETQKRQEQATSSEKISALSKEKENLTNALAQSNQEIVALLANQENLEKNIASLQALENKERNWTDSRLDDRDSLYKSLAYANETIQQLQQDLSKSEQLIQDQKQSLEETRSLASAPNISPELDALYLRANELEYNNARLKDELEATLSLAGEREAILEKRLKSSIKESRRMANRMGRYKRRNKFKDATEEENMDKLALELAEGKAKLKEMNEVNQALLAQLQANNNYLGHNISKRDQYKQELFRLKSGLSKINLENDSLKYIIQNGPAYAGSNSDSLLAYQEKIYKLEQRILLNQHTNQDQIARLNLEIDSLETEVIGLEEEKVTLAQVQKVEASRSHITDDTERKLIQLEYQLKEKDLTLRQKEKVIQEKLKEIEQKEKKYQDMRKWEEELHLLERKLKLNPAYQDAKKEE